MVKVVNLLGISFAIVGAAIMFKFGPPQPEHSIGVNIALENGNILEDGTSVTQYNKNVLKREKKYKLWSKFSLMLIIIGFILQFVAALLS